MCPRFLLWTQTKVPTKAIIHTHTLGVHTVGFGRLLSEDRGCLMNIMTSAELQAKAAELGIVPPVTQTAVAEPEHDVVATVSTQIVAVTEPTDEEIIEDGR